MAVNSFSFSPILSPSTPPISPAFLPPFFSSSLSSIPVHIPNIQLKKFTSRDDLLSSPLLASAPRVASPVFGRHLKTLKTYTSPCQRGSEAQHISECHRGVRPLHHNCSSFLCIDSDAYTGQGLEWAYFQILITSGIRMSNSIFLWGRGAEEGGREGRVMLNLAI